MPKMSAKEYVVYSLSRQEYTRRKLAQRMRDREYESVDIQEALDWAEAKGYLNANRHLERAVQQLYHKQYGHKIFRHKLMEKGFEDGTLRELLPDIIAEYDFDRVALELVQKSAKAVDFDAMDDMTRQRTYGKIVDKLARRGFAFDTINRAMRAAGLSRK